MTYFSRMCELFILLHDITRKYKYSENCGPPSRNKFDPEVGQGHGIVQIERVCHKDHVCHYQYEPGPRSIGRIDSGWLDHLAHPKMAIQNADALATYWRRVYKLLTAAISTCVAKMTQFVMNLMSFLQKSISLILKVSHPGIWSCDMKYQGDCPRDYPRDLPALSTTIFLPHVPKLLGSMRFLFVMFALSIYSYTYMQL